MHFFVPIIMEYMISPLITAAVSLISGLYSNYYFFYFNEVAPFEYWIVILINEKDKIHVKWWRKNEVL